MNDRPWDRQPKEPNRWHARFTAYRLLGSARTIEEVYRVEREAKGREGKRPGHLWYLQSKAWQWKERAEAWDKWEAARVEAEWEERRKEQRERDWQLGKKLQEKARKALKVTKLNSKDIAPMAQTGSKMARMAAEMETEHERLDLNDNLSGSVDPVAGLIALCNELSARKSSALSQSPGSGSGNVD